ncbi:hypothetical protein [Actinosynnema mirum]|uniref:Uncharacterized protein n=1 Tax=Actinosynnema mirum (strain ATCC 29888 / DSM 43827 / JCM 3225 / NBRC 14064 / NCIMB 13271 / NRRL B-12336 / IMRU 3971 / 101) TaxID=446462 RepID=C6WHB1_ACTMD|nr:hypothetical protein [Actinosynnema mirum]ACU38030.1 hypothetical protein Amir_4175 [Actinosynnema mirum DSM 43827]
MPSAVRRAAFAATALTLLSACTTVVDSRAVPAAEAPAVDSALKVLPAQPAIASIDTRLSAALTKLRNIDVCGLLYDETAVTTLFGQDTPSSLMPDLFDLAGCKLKVAVGAEKRGGFDLWLALGPKHPDDDRTAETINGLPVSTRLGEGDARKDRGSCSMEIDVDDRLGLVGDERDAAVLDLTVLSFELGANQLACETARKYLTATAALWQDLPLIGGGRTTPALELATEDPCALAAIALEGDPGGTLRPRAGAMAGCELIPGSKDKPTVDVAFGVGKDPRVKLGSQDDPVDVAGIRVGIDEYRGKCRYAAAWQPEGAFVDDSTSPLAGTPSMQVVHLTVGALCAEAKPIAEKLLPRIVPPSGEVDPNPAGARVRLGDLAAAPAAKDVGAPFDPCDIGGKGWDAFPAQVRHPQRTKPLPLRPNRTFATGCDYSNSDSISITPGEPGSGARPAVFSAIVQWWAPGAFDLAAEAAKPGVQRVDLAGRAGTSLASTKRGGKPTCETVVALGSGTARVELWQDKFPVDPCAVSAAVAAEIVKTAG